MLAHSKLNSGLFCMYLNSVRSICIDLYYKHSMTLFLCVYVCVCVWGGVCVCGFKQERQLQDATHSIETQKKALFELQVKLGGRCIGLYLFVMIVCFIAAIVITI